MEDKSVQIPSATEALKLFFKYPQHPGENATPEQIAAYEARIAEIDKRKQALSSPKADQSAVKKIRGELLKR